MCCWQLWDTCVSEGGMFLAMERGSVEQKHLNVKKCLVNVCLIPLPQDHARFTESLDKPCSWSKIK